MKGACLDFLRSEDYLTRSARQRAVKLRDAGGFEGTAESRALLAAAVAALQKLPPIQQLVIAYHYHQEISLGDIAAGLGLPLDEITSAYESAVVAVHHALAHAACA
jgi:DNA-directed RNA polymerase specialized sigma24 family protein